jgi:hypothetical protein
VAVGVGDFEGAVGQQLGLTAGLMEAFVMPPAQQHQVVEAGGAALGEPFDVVAVAPVGGAITAGESTAAVSDDERHPEGGGQDAGGGADVDDRRAPSVTTR